MKINKQTIIIFTIIFLIIILVIGYSYAYFTSTVIGQEETTTITVTGGTINITYNGGSIININNIIPDNNPAITKTFTITGNSTLDNDMIYQVSLVIEENTFTEEALKYKLISTNTSNSGSIMKSVNELTNIGSGSKIINLGIGFFDVPTNGNKIHSYQLEIYFPETEENQNIDQEKKIKAYVKTENYNLKLLSEEILNQDGGITIIDAKSTPDFSVSNGISGIYASEDDYGITYYYRGEKEKLNNNLIWGGFQWKIVRINGNGSIKLMYNGTEKQFNDNGIVNDNGINTRASGTSDWNLNYSNDAKYVGYMYGGNNGAASYSRMQATLNQTSSNAKYVIDNWYIKYIAGKPIENQIVNNIFCNDRQLSSEVGGSSTGPGYGDTGVHTLYAPYHRLIDSKNPSLKCNLKNDSFTTPSDTIKGNGSLTYPVGLLTADEAVMAGIVFNISNSTNYLFSGISAWFMSPSYKHMASGARVFAISHLGALLADLSVTSSPSIRPVLSITDVKVIGTGSATNPFIIY